MSDDLAFGWKKGRLTKDNILELQRQYGLAIRPNTLTTVDPSKAEVDLALENGESSFGRTVPSCLP